MQHDAFHEWAGAGAAELSDRTGGFLERGWIEDVWYPSVLSGEVAGGYTACVYCASNEYVVDLLGNWV